VGQSLHSNELSKALKTLLNPLAPISPGPEIFDKLQAKHPQDPSLYADNAQKVSEIRAFIIPEEQKLKVNADMFNTIIHKTRNSVRPGLDKLRNRHLKQLSASAKSEPDPDESEFRELMAMLIEDILHENIPQPVRELLSTNEIFAAPKKDGDVRPIGMGLTLRKIAAKVCLNASQGGFNQGKFGTEQSALKEHGMEKICHLIGTEMERDDTLDVYNADGDNAYNVANRVGGAWETMNSFPQALAYARSTYLDPSTAHFFEDSGNIRPISSRVGFHQGDVLATWLYIMSIQPMLKRIIDHVEREFGREEVVHVKFYVDDGNFMAPHHIMLSIISLLENAYDEFGYRLKKNKGSYLLGRCGSAEEANARAQGLVERGFSPEIIKIHPENCEDKDAAKVKYGTKMLGAFLGTDEYIQANLREHLGKLRAEAKLLMEYPDVQGRYHLFKMCLMNKPNHLMRTTRPDLMAEFIGEWDKIVMLVIESFFHCALDTFTRDNVCLPTSLGGIGIHKPGETYVAAYTASFSEFLSVLAGAK
jgi:hypothetical protein